ncbi:MAG TPA: DUF1223 domain-containing protein [Candidatus Angelobacter sp.]
MCTVKFIWLRGAVFLAAIVLPLFLATQNRSAAPASSPGRKAVVVELFTSEGCSSCPPADALLGRLRQEKFADGVEVIPLGLHVDYWNFQGWTDRFSSASYSERQAKYAQRLGTEGPYTPQMVVDGASQFVGSDASRARQAIVQAAHQPQAAEVEISAAPGDKVLVRIKAAPATSGEVLLAITEDNLTSSVRAGENNGRELHHAAVVRELRSLGRLGNGAFESVVPLKLKSDWKRENTRIAVFVQEEKSGRIGGAAAVAAASLSGAR